MVNFATEVRRGRAVQPRTLEEACNVFRELREQAGHALQTQRDNLPEWCAEASSTRQAISRACLSRRPNGKIHNHQSRVPPQVREAYRRRVTRRIRTLEAQDTFDGLHDILAEEAARTPGVGDVMVYDVATRIGAFLRLQPVSVYLHAGVAKGAAALELRVQVRPGGPGILTKRVLPRHLPEPLRRWPPDEVEDFLCTFRDVLGQLESDR